MAGAHLTVKCNFCDDKTMRCDNYPGHMRTHIRDMLLHDTAMLDTCVANQEVVVYYKSTTEGKNRTQLHYKFAVCLSCGDHTSYVGNNTLRGIRYVYKEDYLSHKYNTEPSECEEWIAKHNRMCNGRYDTVKDWYNKSSNKLKLPERPKEAKAATTESTPRATKAQSATVGVSDRVVCDEIVKQFGDIFDYYNYDSGEEEIDEDDEDAVEERKDHRDDRARQRAMTYVEMIARIRKSYDYQVKNAQKVNKNRQVQFSESERLELLNQCQALEDRERKLLEGNRELEEKIRLLEKDLESFAKKDILMEFD